MPIITHINTQVYRTDNETELETDERYQIGDTTKIKRIDTQECRLGDNNEDNETELGYDTVYDIGDVKKKPNKNITNMIEEFQQDDKVLDEKIDFLLEPLK